MGRYVGINMKKILSVIYLVIFYFSNAYAMEGSSYDIEILRQKKFKDLEEYTAGILAMGIEPQKILLVLDNNGTITKDPSPALYEKPRGNAVQYIEEMIKIGVHIVVSSAWDEFERTISSLNDLGLHSTLSVDNDDKEAIDCIYTTGQHISGYKQGKVCSIKYTYEGSYLCSHAEQDYQYYRLKALAPFFVYSEEDIKNYQYVLFADDSIDNIIIFNNEISKLGLNQNAKIRLFSLLNPAKEEQ